MVDFSAPGRNSSIVARKRRKRSFESPEKQTPPPARCSVFPTPRNVAVRPDGDQDAILAQIPNDWYCIGTTGPNEGIL